MNAEQIIMVQILDREWTQEALHCACRLARNTSATIVLVKMIPVQHPGWLGTDLGYQNFTAQEQAEYADYQTTLEDYGVEFTALLFQYLTLTDAIAQAAEHVNAQIVFARVPDSIIPFWTQFQQWSLKRQLTRQQRRLIKDLVYDLDDPLPAIEAFAGLHHR